MNNVLITGGAGFVGHNLAKSIFENSNITIVDRLLNDHPLDCQYVESTVQEYLKFRIPKFDVIYHLAADARIQPSFLNPRSVIDNNFNSTLAVADYARETGAKVVFATTSSHSMTGTPAHTQLRRSCAKKC